MLVFMLKDDFELQERQKDAYGTEPLLPLTSSLRTFDYVLVAHIEDHEKEHKAQKRKAFIEQLEKKNIFVANIFHDDKVFFGLRGPIQMLEDYHYLLKVSDSCNSCGEQPFMPTYCFLLSENLNALLEKNVFETVLFLITFCFLNDTSVQCYFGEKVALYYLWLGWYTQLLVPAAVLGVVVFLYGLAFFNTSPLITEVCTSNIIMCPRCDNKCKVWKLSDTCAYSKISHLFDNEGTVAFAMFMAIWATVFLELWKRHRATYVSRWKVYDWSELEEELILDIVNDPNCRIKRYNHSYLQSTIVLVLVTLMLIIGLAQALVVFRVVAAPWLSECSWEFIHDNANTVAVMLGAVLHYVTIQIMTRLNCVCFFYVLALCMHSEETNSSAATERSFTVKMFTFQFFTLFSSLFYVAFFLGRINGHPGNYARIARWRLEECHPSGCLTDLFIQMAVIMLLKQTLNNIVEFTGPWMKSFLGSRSSKKLQRKCGQCNRKACRDEDRGVEPCDICKLQDWLRNYKLAKTDAFSLFNEFLEMVVQFSFTTIFVAAFPLAPLLALINNIFEIRLDAIKMVRLERRLVPRKTNDIGVWTKVLEAVGVLAVIANGLVIGVSSDFIPRLVYRYRYGPCANGTTDTHCMEGYINDTLSTGNWGIPVTYRDYRNSEDHSLTSQFWLVLAVRFAFIILFEHVMVVCKFIVAWFVPDNPTQVKNDRLEDKLDRLKEEFQEVKRNRSTDV
uniref:Anoctamin n=1 Tax=Anabas testudineus TaxID=64144 RepID=A0A3Q1HXK2_ANATE